MEKKETSQFLGHAVEYLRPASGIITISWTDGLRTIAQAHKTFDKRRIDDDCHYTDMPCAPTLEVKGQAFDLALNRTTKGMLDGLGGETVHHCFFQSQVLEAYEENAWLFQVGDCETIFPFQLNGKYFLAITDWRHARVRQYRYENDWPLIASDGYRLFLPCSPPISVCGCPLRS